jgi:hypothetical protein
MIMVIFNKPEYKRFLCVRPAAQNIVRGAQHKLYQLCSLFATLFYNVLQN